jgi:fructoselysine-6-P-deglycase FrlB-like protein
MANLEQLIARAQTSELFSAPHLEADLGRFMLEQAETVRALAADARSRGTQTIYFVGSGGSWASMYSGKFLCDRFTSVASDVALSYDLTWRAPRRLGPDALVVVASYSGATEDTLAALRFANDRGARTVALVRDADSPIGSEAAETFAYHSPGLYSLPLMAVSLLALEWGRLDGNPDAAALMERLDEVPAQVGAAFRSTREHGRELAEQLGDSDLLYCVGAGPLYGLAYKFGLTVFMENMRINGSVIESGEFRHGPAEALERQRPDVAVVVGTDESRPMTVRTLEFLRANGARPFVFDAADHPGVHPLLTPFVMKVALQWFIVHATLARGISDLDARVYMGRQVLSQDGARWP